MLFRSRKSTRQAARKQLQSRFARQLRAESLEERRLLTAAPTEIHVEVGPQQAVWRFESTADPFTEIHHGPDGSHEFVWEPVTTADDIGGKLNHSQGDNHDHDHGLFNGHDHGHLDNHQHDHESDDGYCPIHGCGACHCNLQGLSSILEPANKLNSGLAESSSTPSGGNAFAAVSLSAIPQLSSLPQATAKLFLDFDGHYESTWGSYSNLVTPVYDVDGDQSSFSSEELSNIQEIWERVAEDFAPFNIDVTTIQPPVLADSVPDDNANGVALRIAIGGSWEDWRGSVSGGTAYVDSYTSSIPNVAYVFSVNRSAGNPRSVAETVSHEAGHAYGLRHQSLYDASGTQLEEYNPGVQDDWAPLMGQGASNTIETSIWYNGPNIYGPTSYQDDLALLTRSQNQFGYRSDEVGDTISTAEPLSFDGQYWTASGIIETNSDVDVFSFSTNGGKHVFEVGADNIAPNLDAVIELRDSSGSIVATDNPTDSRSARIVSDLTAGDYFLFVTKAADYGFIGSYSVRGFEGSPGPRVASVLTTGVLQTGFDTIRADFDAPVDPATFGVDDVQLAGPTGEMLASSVSVVADSNDRKFDIQFATTASEGLYDLTIGPNILDPTGNPMNQNEDETSGGLDDAFTERFSVRASGWSVELDSSFSFAPDSTYISPSGTLYLTGEFAGTADFDPGPGVVERTSQLSQTGSPTLDAFVAIYTPNGEFLQVHTFTGNSTEYVEALDFDASGNAYIAGTTSSSDAQFGSTTVVTQGSRDAYLLKLTPSGNVDWVRTWGSNESDSVSDLKIAPSGNLMASGMFRGSVDFDPGAGTTALTSGGIEDAYVAEYTTDGNFVSVESFTGSNYVKVVEIGFDDSGNMYVAGRFRDTAQFQYGGLAVTSLTSAGQYDTFLLKVNSSGDLEWIRQLSGADHVTFPAMAVSASGKVTLGGRFRQSMQLDTTTLTSVDSYDGYVSQWDSAGNLISAGTLGGLGNEYIREIDIDASGDILVSGTFYDSSDFDPGTAVVNRTASGADGFLIRLDKDGSFKHVHQMEADSGWIKGVASDSAGNLFATGRFYTGSAKMPTGESFETDSNVAGFIMKLAYAPGITVTPLDGLQTSESGDTDQFSVVLDVAPTADVTIDLASSDTGEASLSPSSLTFTPTNWNIPQVVTVAGVDDSTIDGDAPYQIITQPPQVLMPDTMASMPPT